MILNMPKVQRKEVVLIADPRILQIPIQENYEPLINLKNQNEILFGPSPEIENNLCYTWMRQSVYTKLCEAQRLLPSQFRFCLYEALRTVELQKELFDTRWNTIRTQHPNWTDSEIYEETIRMVSPVKTLEGNINIPPHSTGAAVDVYLVDSKTLLPVDMGILAKDWMMDVEGEISRTDSSFISEEAKKHREILSRVMTSVGFVNYPTEYWHWSYGDRYWAYFAHQPYGFFGPAQIPIT